MKIASIATVVLLFGLNTFAGGGALNSSPKQSGANSVGSGILRADFSNPNKANCAATAEFKLVMNDGRFLEVYGTAYTAVYSMGHFVSCNYNVKGGLTNIVGLTEVKVLKMYDDQNVTASIRAKINDLYAYFSGGPRLHIDKKGQSTFLPGGNLGLSDQIIDVAYGLKGLFYSNDFQSAKSDNSGVSSPPHGPRKCSLPAG